MALEWPIHDPAETIDYHVDWSFALFGDTLTSSVFTLPAILDANGNNVNAGLAIVAQSFSANFATARISGGTLGEEGIVLNTVTTAAGQTLVQRIGLPIGNN